jgi:5-methylcytosine-specific restriction endonuclease McrA
MRGSVMKTTSQLKRSGFRKPSYEEVIKNQKAKKVVKKKPTKKKKPKLKTLKTLRNRNDKLLTPLVKKRDEMCLLCPYANPPRCNPTQVAHHHVHKSQSSALRYEMDNLINLCNPCHMMLHNNESYWASVIVKLKGLDWFEDLERKKHVIQKVNRQWYEDYYKKLTKI